jgi:hypothetical protein
MTFAGSNPKCPASQCGLSYSISGCARTADIPAGWLARPSLWPANSGISGPDWRPGGASLCSPFSNFRFGTPETGPIGDGDRFCGAGEAQAAITRERLAKRLIEMGQKGERNHSDAHLNSEA